MRIVEAFGNLAVGGDPLAVEFEAKPRRRHLVRTRKEFQVEVANGRGEQTDEDVDVAQSQRTS